MNITFEIRILCHFYGFSEYRFMTPGLQNPSLMKSQRTETTATKTTTVACETEFDFFQSRNAAHGIIDRMPCLTIRKIVDIVHFLLRKRKRRRVLDNISSVAVVLCKRMCGKRICIAILYIEAFGICFFVCSDGFKRWKYNRIINTGKFFAFEDGPRNIGDFLDRNSALKSFCNLNDGMLSHSI